MDAIVLSQRATKGKSRGEEYSKQELIKFLNYLRDKNLVKNQTAKSWLTAVSNLLSDLSEAEEIDVRTIDIDLAVHRAANRAANNISPSSLRAYRTRTKRALEEFVSWKKNPAEYRPLSFNKTQPNLGARGPSKSKQTSTESQQDKKPNFNEHSVGKPSVHSSGLNLSYPLRPDFLAQIIIPRDLSQLEAKRLGAFILTLSSDYQPE